MQRLFQWFQARLSGPVNAISGGIAAMMVVGGGGFTFERADAASPGKEGGSADQLWSSHVEPLLNAECLGCHGPLKQKSGLDLSSFNGMLKGGEHGPALVPGKPELSRLYQATLAGADPHMPPGKNKQLSEVQRGFLKQWIERLPVLSASSNASPADVAKRDSHGIAGGTEARARVWTPPQSMPGTKVIDRFVELGWRERQVKPAAPCSDETFVRRVHLDLAGRIPTVSEREAFLQDRARNRRERLVDRLLAGEEFADHMREIFDVVLMGRAAEGVVEKRESNHWHAFLRTSFAENRPWNVVVRELLVARPEREESRGASWFLYERNNNHQAMAEAAAPIAFGMQVNCAQCHNHPLAKEIEQRHYWGLVAAFNRSKNQDTTEGPAVSESAVGGFVNFANLKKESQPALLSFLNGKTVDEPRPADGVKEEDSVEKYLVPPAAKGERAAKVTVPKFSRRDALAGAVIEDNPKLALAFVNRAWALFMGRGLVHPVDQMDSKHPPSHPDLLQWLGRDFERSGYDMRRLFKNLLLSRAYQLDAGMPPRGGPPSVPESFSRALEKPLSGEVLARSMAVASGLTPSDLRVGQGSGFDWKRAKQVFVERFPDLFAVENNATLQQALFLTNNSLIERLLEPDSANLTGRMVEMKREEDRVQAAFISVLGRAPDPLEMEKGVAFLKVLKERPASGVKQLVWALVAGAEFQTNH